MENCLGTSSNHHFFELSCNFWDSENIISKNYKIKKEENKDNKEIITSLEKSYKVLIDSNKKKQYLSHLLNRFVSSQPNSLSALSDDYSSLVYPFYLFSLNPTVAYDYDYLILDYINFTIQLYNNKNEIIKMIEIRSVKAIEKDENKIILIFDLYNKNITVLYPEIITQTELIYVLIMFMRNFKRKKETLRSQRTLIKEVNQNLTKKKEKKNVLNEKIEVEERVDVNDLKIFENDYFIPNGIKAFSYVFIDKPKKNNNFDYFITLGTSYLFLFKNEQMNQFDKMIPMSPGFTIIEFKEESFNMKIKTPNEELSLFFPNDTLFHLFREIVNDISDKKINEGISIDELEIICLNKSTGNISDKNKLEEQFPIKSQKIIEKNEAKIQTLLNKKELLIEVFKQKEEEKVRRKKIVEIRTMKEGAKSGRISQVEEFIPKNVLGSQQDSITKQLFIEKD